MQKNTTLQYLWEMNKFVELIKVKQVLTYKELHEIEHLVWIGVIWGFLATRYQTTLIKKLDHKTNSIKDYNFPNPQGVFDFIIDKQLYSYTNYGDWKTPLSSIPKIRSFSHKLSTQAKRQQQKREENIKINSLTELMYKHHYGENLRIKLYGYKSHFKKHPVKYLAVTLIQTIITGFATHGIIIALKRPTEEIVLAFLVWIATITLLIGFIKLEIKNDKLKEKHKRYMLNKIGESAITINHVAVRKTCKLVLYIEGMLLFIFVSTPVILTILETQRLFNPNEIPYVKNWYKYAYGGAYLIAIGWLLFSRMKSAQRLTKQELINTFGEETVAKIDKQKKGTNNAAYKNDEIELQPTAPTNEIKLGGINFKVIENHNGVGYQDVNGTVWKLTEYGVLKSKYGELNTHHNHKDEKDWNRYDFNYTNGMSTTQP
jgi:hypothetical protein